MFDSEHVLLIVKCSCSPRILWPLIIFVRNNSNNKHKINVSTHSEMGPVWQNPIQRTVRTAQLIVLTTVHSFSTQNSSDNLPSYLQTTIIAQMLSIWGEGAQKERATQAYWENWSGKWNAGFSYIWWRNMKAPTQEKDWWRQMFVDCISLGSIRHESSKSQIDVSRFNFLNVSLPSVLWL